MAEGQRERDWSYLAWMAAHLANCHRGAKTKPFKPADFNPLIDKRESVIEITRQNIGLLRRNFVKKPNLPRNDN